jgi:hypothetical protein
VTTEDTSIKIAKELGEVDETPLAQIAGIVRVLGDSAALALLKETLQVEKDGGMPYSNGSGRRSPGGVFFQLARKELAPEDKRAIFREKKPQADVPAPSSELYPKRPRPRVVEVVPDRSSSKSRGATFKPPDLAGALARSRIRQQVTSAIAPLSQPEQYRLLLDMLADLHEVHGGDASSASPKADAPRGRTRRK